MISNHNKQNDLLNTEPKEQIEDTDFRQVTSQIIAIGWGVMGVVTGIYMLIGLVFFLGGWFSTPRTWFEWPLSYVLGAMVNFLAFNALKNNVAALSQNTKIASPIANYFLRFILYGFVLYFAYVSPRLNPFIVASGYFTIRVAIYIFSFIHKNDKSNNGGKEEKN